VTSSLLCLFIYFHLTGYQACGVIAKLLFVGNLTEAHLGIFEAMNIQLAAMKLANTTRRNFLRYVFHEVGVSVVCFYERPHVSSAQIICLLPFLSLSSELILAQHNYPALPSLSCTTHSVDYLDLLRIY
jgi:hypothetical protein